MADSINPSTTDQQHKYRTYHPYQQFNVPIQNLYHLPTSPEFLFQEELHKTRRSWGENLTFYTGSGYLAGAVIGSAKGSVEGIRAAGPGESLKLRANRVLNSGGIAARRAGNCLGVLGLMFAALESGVTHLRGGDDGLVSTVVAGLGTGAIYRAASGPRSAAIAGAVGGVAAMAAFAGKQVAKRFVPI